MYAVNMLYKQQADERTTPAACLYFCIRKRYSGVVWQAGGSNFYIRMKDGNLLKFRKSSGQSAGKILWLKLNSVQLG